MDFDGPAPHGGGPPTPEAQLFALLKPLRGSLVRTSVVGAAGKAEKGVRVVAARRDADNGGVSLVIALVSERPTELELELELAEHSGAVLQSAALAMDAHGVSVVQPAIMPGAAFVVPPLGVLVIQQELRSAVSAIQRRQVVKEVFCPGVFNAVSPISLGVN